MSDFPDKQSQTLKVHASFIRTVVFAISDESQHPMLEQHLQTGARNGWQELIKVIRKIKSGQRNMSFTHLDDEDQIIADAILKGIQNPNTLPEIPTEAESSNAAPGLAAMIHEASCGDTAALQALGTMAEQMSAAGGSMARVGASFKILIDGERDIDKLSDKLDDKGLELIKSIVNELNRRQAH